MNGAMETVSFGQLNDLYERHLPANAETERPNGQNEKGRGGKGNVMSVPEWWLCFQQFEINETMMHH